MTSTYVFRAFRILSIPLSLSWAVPLRAETVAGEGGATMAPRAETVAGGGATVPLRAETPGGEGSEGVYARARALYRRASSAFEKGEYDSARHLLLDAWALRRSYDVAASLGDTEIKLGLFPEAAEHLSFSLRNFPPLENEAALARVRSQLETARREVASLRISVDQPGAEVRVDRRAIGMAPLPEPVFVDPGIHLVEARRGDVIVTRRIFGAAASEHAVALKLGPAAAAPEPDDELARRSPLPLIVGGAVVAAGLTAGIAFRLSANGYEDHASGIRSSRGPSACVGAAAASSDCVALRSDVNGARRSQALSTAGFIVAGVGLIATPVWWLLSPPEKTSTTVGISGVLRADQASVVATGRF